ncbi:PTS sugar transporter subunit IIA [soil metagenome]
MLKEAVDRESISLGAEVEDWKGAVELSGKLLAAADAVEEGYGPAMVRMVEELGPYAVIAPGVAIPHARPEDGALEVGVSITVLQTPVEFGSEENDPVDLLFGFATPNKDDHVDTIRGLVNFIKNGENLEALRQADTVDEVMGILERHEENN